MSVTRTFRVLTVAAALLALLAALRTLAEAIDPCHEVSF